MIEFGLSNKSKQLIEIIRIAALFAGAAILFFACENDIEKIKAFTSAEDLPIAEANDFYTQSTDSGRINYTLKAPRMLQFERDGKRYVEFPAGMEIKSFDKKGNMISSMRSDYAKQSVIDNKWEASNNVVATNIKGDTLKTEHIIWDREKGTIYNNEYVKIISTDQIIWGEGFTSDEQMDNWEINKVKGNIFVSVNSEESQDDDQLPKLNNDTEEEIPFKMELQFEK